jgi:serine/threonine-protein kinase
VFTARALHDAVERYLEGDRDLSRRRALAAHHIDIANAALGAAATAGADDSTVETHARATAMRELGTAIALDPSNAVAGRAVLRLLAEPPRHIPTAVRDELDAMDRAQVKQGARLSSPLALTWRVFLPFPFFMHVLDWRPIVVMVAAIVVVSVTSAVNVTLERVPLLYQSFNYILLAVLCLSAGFVAGPFVTVPTLIATFVAALQSHPSRAVRRVVVAGGCGLFLTMVGLEWAGVTPTSYVFVDGSIHILPVALGFPEVATRLLMTLTAVGSILSVALFISKMRDSLAAAQQRALVLGWHLRQIVPDAVD